MPRLDTDAPEYHFPDEEPDVHGITGYGWDQTNEAHGYCTFCGHRWEHTTEDCPSRAPKAPKKETMTDQAKRKDARDTSCKRCKHPRSQHELIGCQRFKRSGQWWRCTCQEWIPPKEAHRHESNSKD